MSAKTARIASNLFNLVVILAMFFGPLAQIHVQAYTDTDKEDYAPGSTVIVSGDNRNFEAGKGYLPGETVEVTVTQPVSADPLTCSATVGEDGSWSCELHLNSDPAYAVGLYTYKTLGLTSNVSEDHSFTDAPPSIEQLWQCDPPNVFNPDTYTCESISNSGWSTGNNNGPYYEGDTIPYRSRFQNLASGNAYSVTIEWDTTKSGKHAIDFLETYNATMHAADPCISLTGLPAGLCSGGSSTIGIPADTFMQADSQWVANVGVQDPGVFTMYGATITSVSGYTTPPNYNGDTSTSITVFFTASSTDAVLAWGGHIAERADWGMDNSAVFISGSPYHMRFIAWQDVTHQEKLNVGNTDRSLSADAVIYPASITIVKQAVPEGSQSFGFTASPAPLSDFSLVDNGTSANTKVFSNITDFKTYTVTESTPAGWGLDGIVCAVAAGTANGGTQTVNGASVAIDLKEGELVTCTYSNTRTLYADLTVSKTATASFGRDYKWLIEKNVDKTEIDIPEGGTATFNYSVKVTPNGYTDSAWAVTGKITVANPNPFDVSGVNVTDAIDNGGVCTVTNGTNVTVPKNGNVVLDYSCTYTAAPSPAAGTNTATAAWTAEKLYSPHTSATGTASVDFSTVTPTESHKIITVVDDKTDPLKPVTLGTWKWADGEHTFTYSLVLPGVAGTCTDYTNTARIVETNQPDSKKVTVCVGKDLTVSKTAAASKDRTYKWLIYKSVNQTQIDIAQGGTATFNYSVKVKPDGYTDSAFALGGTITVTNPNDWEAITLTSVVDTLDKGGSCTITETAPYVVPKSGSLTLHYTCTSDGSTTNNHAAVTWDKAAYFTPNGSVSADAAVSFTIGTETNKTITVVDDKTDPLNPVTLGTWNWADGEHTFTYSLDKPGVAGTCTDYTNIAKIVETNQSDSQKVTVCVGKDLTVTKTAEGTFDRTYLWTIHKKVDKTSVNIAEGGTATFHYTVDVAQTGVSDSGWTLSGKITITNPNNWEAITLTGVTDGVTNGGTCTVDPGPYVVPKSGTLDVNYSCSFASGASPYTGTNTAYITWDAAAYHTPTGAANGSAGFTLAQSGSTNKTIHVTDSYADALGTVTANEAAPFAGTTFEYDRTESGVAGTCTQYDNTASITETGQADSQSVKVCVGKDLTVSKTAAGTFDRTYLWSIDKKVDKTSVNIAEGGNYTFHYTVDAVQTGISDSGWTLSGKITLTNPNDWEAITLTSLSDAVDNGGICTVAAGPYVVPANSSLEVGYSCAYSSAPTSYSGTNTATASWNKSESFTPNDTSSGTAGFTLSQLGFTNKTVHVTDSYGGDLGTVTAKDVEPFDGTTFEYDRTVSGVAGTCTTYDNTARITETDQADSQSVKLCVGKDLTVTKTAAASKDRTYKWQIDKSVDQTQINIAQGGTAIFTYSVKVTPNGYTDSAFALGGTITISNPNDWEAIPLTSVADTLDQGGSCTITETAPYVVPKSGSLTLHYICSTEGTTTKNTVTATWDKAVYFTPNGSVSADATVSFTIGTETNQTITVVDDKTDPLNPVTLGTWNWADGEHTFTYALEKPGVPGVCTDYNNIAKISETNQSDGQKVTVCVGKDLTVSKTATPAFTRTWSWTIAKDYDGTYNMFAGQSTTHGYKVTVTPTYVDSAWVVTGTISIHNPNAWEDITLTSLSDVVDNGGTCTVAPGPYLIPKGASAGFTYSCSYAAQPAYTATNTATASWDKAAAFTPTGSASGSQGFTFANPTEVNPVIHVDDSNLTGENWSATRASGAWTYTKIFACSTSLTAYTAGKYSYVVTNTATITETSQSDSATVTVNCIYPQLIVDKTVNGEPFAGAPITFQLRQGASMISEGTILETQVASVSNNGHIVFTHLLLPGTYQLVEQVPLGYLPSFVHGTYGVDWFRPTYLVNEGGMDVVIWAAVNFTVNADGSITFEGQNVPLAGSVHVDNAAGQMPFTIGYWKNHAFAKTSNGNQTPVLDQMLCKATTAGRTIMIGTRALPGCIPSANNAGTSTTYAVRLLNKSTVITNLKKASDPAWNMAAQLLGYRLNQELGAWPSGVADQAATIGQMMLVKVNFDGQTYTKPADKLTLSRWNANMNYIAGVLDAYNNGTLVMSQLTMPYPNVGYTLP